MFMAYLDSFLFFVFKSEMDDGDFSNNILKTSYSFIFTLRRKYKKVGENPGKLLMFIIIG